MGEDITFEKDQPRKATLAGAKFIYIYIYICGGRGQGALAVAQLFHFQCSGGKTANNGTAALYVQGCRASARRGFMSLRHCMLQEGQ